MLINGNKSGNNIGTEISGDTRLFNEVELGMEESSPIPQVNNEPKIIQIPLDRLVNNAAKLSFRADEISNDFQIRLNKISNTLVKKSNGLQGAIAIAEQLDPRAYQFWLMQFAEFNGMAVKVINEMGDLGKEVAELSRRASKLVRLLSTWQSSSQTSSNNNPLGLEYPNNLANQTEQLHSSLLETMQELRGLLDEVTLTISRTIQADRVPEVASITKEELNTICSYVTTEVSKVIEKYTFTSDSNSYQELVRLNSAIQELNKRMQEPEVTGSTPEQGEVLVNITSKLNSFIDDSYKSEANTQELNERVKVLLDYVDKAKGSLVASLAMQSTKKTEAEKIEARKQGRTAYKKLVNKASGKEYSDEEIVNMVNNGVRIQQIAGMCGVSYGCIKNHIDTYNNTRKLEGLMVKGV